MTGGYAGVGLELCKILYAHDATVCIAGRSETKAKSAISIIKKAAPNSSGQLEFLQLDLSDLSTIKPAVQTFTARQERLDVLVNNAGVRFLPVHTNPPPPFFLPRAFRALRLVSPTSTQLTPI